MAVYSYHTYTFSGYIKRQTTDKSVVTAFVTSPYTFVDMVIDWTTAGGPSFSMVGTYVGAALTHVGDDWYKFSITLNAGAGTAISFRVYVKDQSTSVVAGVSILLWGLSFSFGEPRNYVPSTTVLAYNANADLTAQVVHSVDSSGGPITLQAPQDLRHGQSFEVVDVGGSASTNNITVIRGSVKAIANAAEDFVIDVNRWAGKFTYDSQKGLVVT